MEATKKLNKRGGWRAIKYILGNESFEKLASMSLIANLTVYLQNKYHLGGVYVVNVVSIWSASSNIITLAGAFISDTYLGRFRTLLIGSLFSLLGMGTVAFTAGVRDLRPPDCKLPPNCIQPKRWQLGVLFSGLALLSIGAGGIRPCNIAFGADQFDTRTLKGKTQLETFFNWWYFSFTIALVIALTGVVYIQSNISWLIGFIIPTVCLAFSLFIFLIGRHTYIYLAPQGSVFTDIVKVATAAVKKRKVIVRSSDSFYDVITSRRLEHTDRFVFFDKAAVITDSSELDENSCPKNNWRLCSVQQVERFKCLIAVMPVWVSGIACFMLMNQQNTFGLLQAIQTNKSMGSRFTVPPGWMNLTSMIALSIWILIYECLIIPLGKKMTAKDLRLSMKQRILIGIVLSILGMIVAGLIETKRRSSAIKHNSFASPMTIGILLPQFVLSGLTEAFAAVAIMEFLTVQMPEDMRTVAGAMFFLSSSVADYISSAIVNLINSLTRKHVWLGGHDLNKNKLENYYFIMSGVGVINLLYFTCFASRYVYDINVTKDNSVSCVTSNMSDNVIADPETGFELTDRT